MNVCGDLIDQNSNLSEEMSTGTMRIVLHWSAGSGVGVLDSHLTGPDNASGRFHVYYNSVNGQDVFYYATNDFSCSSCTASQKSDNITLDQDDYNGAPGTETITISSGAWKSGTYRYSAHYYGPTSSGQSSGYDNNTKFAESGATVKVYFNGNETTYNVPNSAGTLWTVFTIDGSSKVITIVDNMSAVAGTTSGSASIE